MEDERNGFMVGSRITELCGMQRGSESRWLGDGKTI